MFRWKKVVGSGREQGRQLGSARYLEVHYEDLTTTPEDSLRRICVFLGLGFHAEMLDSAQPYLQSVVDGATRGLQRNSGKWHGYFSPRTVENLERIAGRTLAACGYATHLPEADHDVAAWRRKYWSTLETLRQYAREIYRKLTGDLRAAVARHPRQTVDRAAPAPAQRVLMDSDAAANAGNAAHRRRLASVCRS